MNYERALTFMKDDDKWVSKIAIGSLMGFLSFLLLPSFILVGYSIQIARNTMDGFDSALPEWDDMGKYLKDGFIVSLAMIVYALPVIILFTIAVLPILFTDGSGFGVGITMLVSCITMIYVIALVVIAPAVYVQFIREGTFGACLRFGDVMGIVRNNLGSIIMVTLVLLAVQFVINLVGGALMFLFGLGVLVYIVGYPYTLMVTGHLYGQLAASLGSEKGGKADDMVVMS